MNAGGGASEASGARHTRAAPTKSDGAPPRGAAGARDGDLKRRIGLEAIEKRRRQLWIFAAVLLVLFAGGMVLLTVENPFVGIIDFAPLPFLRATFIALAVTVGVYLLTTESRLRITSRLMIEEAVTRAALNTEIERLSRLAEMGKAINNIADHSQVTATIARSALELTGASEAVLLLPDDEGALGVAAVAPPAPNGRSPGGSLLGPARAAAKGGGPVVEDGGGGADRPSLAVPLAAQDRIYGVIAVAGEAERPFGEREQKLLGLLAEQALTAIINASAFHREHETVSRLEELDRMKTEFLATVTHELKTPLSAIIASARLMRKKGPDLDDGHKEELLELVEAQGEKQLRMIGELLAAARLETGTHTLQRRRIDLMEIARRAIGGFKSLHAGRSILLEGPSEAVAFADAAALEQVLTNLIDNAIKYSDAGRPVTVRIEDLPSEARLEVRDEGKGIPQDMIEVIFERFQQIDPSDTRRAGGVGLGLFIVKSLVEGMQGTVSVTSREGEGTAFTIVLPKRQEAQAGG